MPQLHSPYYRQCVSIHFLHFVPCFLVIDISGFRTSTSLRRSNSLFLSVFVHSSSFLRASGQIYQLDKFFLHLQKTLTFVLDHIKLRNALACASVVLHSCLKRHVVVDTAQLARLGHRLDQTPTFTVLVIAILLGDSGVDF